MFHEEAKCFYLDHVDCVPTYVDAKTQLMSRYCSKSHQIRAQQNLRRFGFAKSARRTIVRKRRD
jgi:hypothetical protein